MELFDTYWQTTNIPLQSEKAIVIVERRCHPNLEFCIKNAVYFARGYSLYIYCSETNKEFVKTICGKQTPNIHILPIFSMIGTGAEGKTDYNNLLKKAEFWESIDAKYCLTIETDCYLRNYIPDTIMQYDYVASKWPWHPDEPGGGGLSFRNRDMMIRLCKENTIDTDPMQDSFASAVVKKYRYKYPTNEENFQYFIECNKSFDPIGVHQWWTFLQEYSPDVLIQYIECYITLEI